MKKILILGLIVCSLLIVPMYSVVAAEEKTFTDPENDVMDILGEYTNQKPNIDIISLDYSRDGKKVTLTLGVKGVVQNRGDIDEFEYFEEPSVSYNLNLETLNESYDILYVNGKCRLSYIFIEESEDLSTFSVSNSILTVSFDLLDADEIYSSIAVASMDYAPPYSFYFDEFVGEEYVPLEADAGGPYEGVVEEDVNFSVVAYGGVFPYTWEWDLDGDGFYHELESSNNLLSPAPGTINPDHFSVEWSGYVYIDHDETEYTFRVLSDDGIILQIGTGIAINMPNKEGLSYQEWTGEMDAGLNWIKLSLREKTGDAVCRLYWRTEVDEDDPCYIKNDIIPASNLYSDMSTSGGLNAEYFNNEDWDGAADLTRIDPTVDFIWGTGDIGPSDPDYTPEVYVGRIPVYNDDYEQLDQILRKIINYETDPGDISWRESVLLPMVRMNDTTTSAGLGEVIKDYIAVPNGFSYYRIYEPDSGFTPELTPPTIDNVKNEWNFKTMTCLEEPPKEIRLPGK